MTRDFATPLRPMAGTASERTLARATGALRHSGEGLPVHGGDSGSAALPIFADSTGTRRRWFKVLGSVSGILLAGAAAVLAAGFVDGGTGYLPGLPGAPLPAKAAPAAAARAAPAAATSRPHPAPTQTACTPEPAGNSSALVSVTVAPTWTVTGIARPYR